MHGRREAGGPSRGRVLGVVAIGAGLAGAGALILAMTPAQAEASNTTATLTLTGVRDSNCPISTGGTTVRVAPNGTVTFKAELAGISVRVPITTVLGTTYVTVPLDSGHVASFNDKLVIDGRTNYPHYVSGTKSYVLRNVAKGNHKIAWSANSVQLLAGVVPGVSTVALNANTVVPSSLPAGGELDWVGTVNATSASAKCGISAEIPGGKVTLGPIKATLHPVILPTVTLPKLPSVALPKLPGVPGTNSTSSGSNGTGNGVNYTQPPLTVPQRVVPHPGGGGSAEGALAGDSANAQPGSGGTRAAGAAVVGSTSTAAGKSTAASNSQPAKTLSLSNKQAAGPQLPVLLTVLAFLALSLVTAAYARMHLQRRHS